MTHAVSYLHIKQIAISQERRAIWKNYRWSSFIISRVLSNQNKLNFHFMYTLSEIKKEASTERSPKILSESDALITYSSGSKLVFHG